MCCCCGVEPQIAGPVLELLLRVLRVEGGLEIMATTTGSSSGMKEETFKPIETAQSADDMGESHGTRPDLTADTEVKAPGILGRAVEEVQAIAEQIWESVVPPKK